MVYDKCIKFISRELDGEVLSLSYDYSALLGRIVEKFGTQYNFAIAMGLSERSISLKLNGKVSWRDNEISEAVDLLDLDASDIPQYFFKIKVHAT